jgi:hypothetical protein
MTKSEVQKVTQMPSKEIAPVERQVITPMDMIMQAVSSGAQMEVIEKLAALQERWQAIEARKAFDAAMADAKAEIKPIMKNRKVDFTSQKGRTNYDYEGLDDVAREVDPILTKHGLSYRHRASQEEKKLTVMCVMSHRGGHREDCAELSAYNDETGNKNSIQGVGSTATFLQRYTLKLALGLSTTKDTDGRVPTVVSGPISDAQVEELIAIADEIGQNRGDFCEWLTTDVGIEIGSFEEIPASKFARAKYALEAKRRKVKA